MRTAIAKGKEEEAGLELALTAGLAVGFSKMLTGAGEASTRPTGPAATPLSESQKVRATKLLAKMTAATEESVLLAGELEKNEGGLNEFIPRKARS